MKKMKWRGMLGFAAAILASIAMIGCTMELGDEASRAATAEAAAEDESDTGSGSEEATDTETSNKLYVGLGGENTFNISSVEVITPKTVTNSTLTPSAWNAISEYETASISEGSSVSYTFTQAAEGSGAWNTWAVAVYDNATVSSANGTFLRCDNWLNSSTDAGFAAGLWSAGGETAGGTYSNDYTYETAGKSLTSSNTVVVNVAYADSTVTITETIDGTLAYTATGTISE